mgnify:CR=1 FL=1
MTSGPQVAITIGFGDRSPAMERIHDRGACAVHPDQEVVGQLDPTHRQPGTAAHDQVDQGEEFGFIKFGSRVDVFLPLDAKINVEIDQKTKGGRTILAELK